MVKKNQRKGYTLVELMMVATLVGLFSITGGRLLSTLLSFIRTTTARAEVQRDARNNLELIQKFLYQAQSDTVIISSQTTTSVQPPYSKITFTTVQNQTYSFWQDGRNLYMNVNSGARRQLTSNLRQIIFTYPGSDQDNVITFQIATEKYSRSTNNPTLALSMSQVQLKN